MPKRPRQRPKRPELSEEEREFLGLIASYVESPEHKSSRWWGGLPASRQLRGGKVGRLGKQVTTICPLVSPKDKCQATKWVQSAIRLGQYKFYEADKRFAKKIWFKANGTIWFGMCINSESGEYKGWPSNEDD